MRNFFVILFIAVLFYQCKDNHENNKGISEENSQLKIVIIDSMTSCYDYPALVTFNNLLGEVIDTVINQDTDTPPELLPRLFLKSRLSETETKYHYFYFTSGPSCDPNFIVRDSITNTYKYENYILGTNLFIPGDGYFYVSGFADDSFNRHRKFTIKDDKVIEIPQPGYFVGLNSIAREKIFLHSDKELQFKTDEINKGDSVYVILSDKNDIYLLKSKYGITGWAKLKVNTIDNCSIEGLFYYGD